MREAYACIISCEHGGYRIPARYKSLFEGHASVLRSHRGYDPGALELAACIARALKAPLISSRVSRLLVELNRSPHHRLLFSEFAGGLSGDVKRAILGRYYHPYRHRMEAEVARRIRAGRRVLHLSVHTFAPRLNGMTRRADIGLLYDPARKMERRFCEQWAAQLKRRLPDCVIRRNYPYLGKADGLTTHLRRLFARTQYLGIELEVNRRLAYPVSRQHEWRNTLIESLRASLASITVRV